MTKPLFIVGSGRSGTRTFYRMLTGAEKIEINHEYNVLLVQRLAVQYTAGIIDKRRAADELLKIYGPAIAYSQEPIWIDSSNKCSWIIDLLATIFPDAKFLSIVRDGRKVVSSYYYKLREEMYDDRSNEIMTQYLLDPKQTNIPPLEKKFWWYVPVNQGETYEKFKQYDRLERTCFHWAEVNRTIRDKFSQLEDHRTYSVRLEDIISDPEVLNKTLAFIGIKTDEIYFEYLKKPRNVFFPLNFHLNKNQMKKFNEICIDEMKIWGYGKERADDVRY